MKSDLVNCDLRFHYLFLVDLLSSCWRTLRTLSQSFEMLQVVIFSFAFLLSGLSSQECVDFTTNDVEGPFFVSNVPLKVG